MYLFLPGKCDDHPTQLYLCGNLFFTLRLRCNTVELYSKCCPDLLPRGDTFFDQRGNLIPSLDRKRAEVDSGAVGEASGVPSWPCQLWRLVFSSVSEFLHYTNPISLLPTVFSCLHLNKSSFLLLRCVLDLLALWRQLRRFFFYNFFEARLV